MLKKMFKRFFTNNKIITEKWLIDIYTNEIELFIKNAFKEQIIWINWIKKVESDNFIIDPFFNITKHHFFIFGCNSSNEVLFEEIIRKFYKIYMFDNYWDFPWDYWKYEYKKIDKIILWNHNWSFNGWFIRMLEQILGNEKTSNFKKYLKNEFSNEDVYWKFTKLINDINESRNKIGHNFEILYKKPENNYLDIYSLELDFIEDSFLILSRAFLIWSNKSK